MLANPLRINQIDYDFLDNKFATLIVKYSYSVLPRLLLQGAAPCPLFVTPCPFEKDEMTPCPFDFFFKISVTHGF